MASFFRHAILFAVVGMALCGLPGSVSADDPCFSDCQYAFPDGWKGFEPTNDPQCCYEDEGDVLRGSCAEHQPYLFRCDPWVEIQGDTGPYLLLPGNLEVGKNIDNDWHSYTEVYYTKPCYCGEYQGQPNCICTFDRSEVHQDEEGTHYCIDCSQ